MTTTPHPKARRGGRTWTRWAIVSMHGDISTFKTKAAALNSDSWFNIGHGPLRRVTITEVELRRGKGGGKK